MKFISPILIGLFWCTILVHAEFPITSLTDRSLGVAYSYYTANPSISKTEWTAINAQTAHLVYAPIPYFSMEGLLGASKWEGDDGSVLTSGGSLNGYTPIFKGFVQGKIALPYHYVRYDQSRSFLKRSSFTPRLGAILYPTEIIMVSTVAQIGAATDFGVVDGSDNWDDILLNLDVTLFDERSGAFLSVRWDFPAREIMDEDYWDEGESAFAISIGTVLR